MPFDTVRPTKFLIETLLFDREEFYREIVSLLPRVLLTFPLKSDENIPNCEITLASESRSLERHGTDREKSRI